MLIKEARASADECGGSGSGPSGGELGISRADTREVHVGVERAQWPPGLQHHLIVLDGPEGVEAPVVGATVDDVIAACDANQAEQTRAVVEYRVVAQHHDDAAQHDQDAEHEQDVRQRSHSRSLRRTRWSGESEGYAL